tara:strand:+ start:121 stop:249 length:129 start_codon:yes stop_codon:yes gene_type:complete
MVDTQIFLRKKLRLNGSENKIKYFKALGLAVDVGKKAPKDEK